MSPLPYLPSGRQELPARRIVLFANPQNRVMRMDESHLTENGSGFTGEWVSPSLVRADPSRLWTLRLVQVWYTALKDSSFEIAASTDGGSTWTTKSVSVDGGTDELRSVVQVHFNHTGDDIRIRFRVSNTDVKLYGYRPKLQARGEVRHDQS